MEPAVNPDLEDEEDPIEDDPGRLAQAVDQLGDSALEELHDGNLEAVDALLTALDATVDKLLDHYDVGDPGEPDDDEDEG